MGINYNEENPNLSMVACDHCEKIYSMVEDLEDGGEHVVFGCRLDCQKGIFHFCDEACLKRWLKEQEEKK